MSLRSISTATPEFRPPYYHFPELPTTISVDGLDAWEYITDRELDKIIDNFSNRVVLKQFDVLCINLNGGNFFAQKLIEKQGYKGAIDYIEYHQDHQIVTPINKNLLNLKIGVIDDILDTFVTGKMIQRDAPNAQLLYLTKKRGVTPPNTLYNCVWASEIDKVWVLGAGMDGSIPGDGYPKNWGRTYNGIAVKIQN